jgi:HEPN domain-containing protein
VNDLEHAKHSSAGGFFAQASYSAQQAAEKALKALLLHSGHDAGRTHSVVGLRKTLEAAGIEIPEATLSLEDAQELTRLNIETRYPLGEGEDAPFELFGREQARRAIDMAARVVGLGEVALGGS